MTKSKRILIVCPIGSSVDGAFVFNAALTRQLSLNHEVVLLTCGSPPGDFGCAEVVSIPLPPGDFSPRVDDIRNVVQKAIENGILTKRLRNFASFDIIVGHDWVSTREAIKIKDTYYPLARVVGFFHTLPERKFELWENPDMGTRGADIQRNTLPGLDLAVGVGPLNTSSVIRLAKGAPIALSPNIHELIPGFDINQESAIRPAGDELRLLALGRFDDPTKGLRCAIDSVALARQAGAHVRLKIRGLPNNIAADIQAETDKLYQEKGIIKALRFTQDRSEVADDLNKADAGLIPSQVESFSMAAGEFLERGKPILITRDSGIAMFLLHWSAATDDPPIDSVRQMIVDDRGFHSSRFVEWQHPRPTGTRSEVWAKRILHLNSNLTSAQKSAITIRAFLSKFTWQDAIISLLNVLETAPTRREQAKGAAPQISCQKPHGQLDTLPAV